MAHVMRPGDWRSGYYRDQTVMLAVGVTTLEQYFAQLYADADVGREPFSGGRQMSNHYATRIVDAAGHWRDLLSTIQVASDFSPGAAGMPRDGGPGFEIEVVKGWDYVALCDAYAIIAERVRREHVPAIVHVIEMTQPQGHSTSGSHERYKTKERLTFEVEADPIRRMREWMIREDLADAATLDELEKHDRSEVEHIRERAYETFQEPIRRRRDEALTLIGATATESGVPLDAMANELREAGEPLSHRAVYTATFRALAALRGREGPARAELARFVRTYREENEARFNSHLLSESDRSPLR